MKFCPRCITGFLAKLAYYAGKAAKFMEEVFGGQEKDE